MWRCLEAPWANDVAQVIDGIGEDMEVFQFKGYACVAEKRRDMANMFDVIFRTFQKNYDIIEVKECELPLNRRQNDIHCSLKRTRGIP